FSSRRRHTRSLRDWSSDVCSSDLTPTASLRSGFGTAIVDGRLRAEPWAGAGTIEFTAKLEDGRTVPATLFALNDGSNLYLGVRRSEERRVGKECRYRWGAC